MITGSRQSFNAEQPPWFSLPDFSYNNKHITIIGAGIAGTSLAYCMVKTGWRVTLIERNELSGSEASGNPAGIIMPLILHNNDPLGELYWQGFKTATQHINELTGQLQYGKCGIFDLQNAHKDIANLSIPKSEISLEFCETAQQNGLYIKNAMWVNAKEFCESYINNCGKNIKQIFNKSAISITKQGDFWQIKGESGEILSQSKVIAITCANDAKKFSDTEWLPLQKIRGQLTYLPADLTPKITSAIFYKNGYITPDSNGFNCVGATFNHSSFDNDLSKKDHVENLKNLEKFIDLAEVNTKNLDGRVAFRASTPDRRPIAGSAPNLTEFKHDYKDLLHGKQKTYPNGKYLKGLYMSVGHGSKGLTSAPFISELLAKMINGDDMSSYKHLIDLINPARFIIRDIKRAQYLNSN